jgi:hypothetical protein
MIYLFPSVSIGINTEKILLYLMDINIPVH